MTASVSLLTEKHTLSELLLEGEIPVAEALRYATGIAESLRNLHDSGKVHGLLAPSAVTINRTSIELMDMPGLTDDAKHYVAPEVLAGEPADVRSDIFSLGAILCAMLAGPHAFETERGIHVCEAMSVSSPDLEHLLSQCLAKDPAMRPQRIQRVLLELKFATITIRRAEGQAATAIVREISRSVERLNQRLVAAEQEIEEFRRYSTDLEGKLAASLQAHEQILEDHAAAIESAQSAAEQTDNLMERVVDTLDLLQSTLIDQGSAGQPGAK
jgi:hypothetical protein